MSFAMLGLEDHLLWIKKIQWFPVLSLNSWHRQVQFSWQLSVFFHHIRAGEQRDASVPDSTSHLSQSALAEFGLAGTPSARCRSCVSTPHTHMRTHMHRNKTHSWKQKAHTHMIPQSRGLLVPNYCNDMETLQSKKHLAFPPPLHVNTNVFFEKRKRERDNLVQTICL